MPIINHDNEQENLPVVTLDEDEQKVNNFPEDYTDINEHKQNIAHNVWFNFVFLNLAVIFGMSTWFSASAVLPTLKSTYGISNTEGSFLTISVNIGFVIGAVASSLFLISDRIAIRKLIAAGSFFAGLFNLLLLIESIGFTGAVFGRFFTGMSMCFVYPPAMKLMSTWFVQGRGLALGAITGAVALGSALPLLTKALGGISWKLVIFSTSSMSVIAGFLIIFLVKDGPYPFPSRPFSFRQLGVLFKNKRLFLAIAAYSGHNWELYALWSWISAFLTARLENSSSSTISALSFFVVASGFIGCVAAGYFADKYGRLKIILISLAISAICSLAAGHTHNSILLVALCLIWGITVVSDSAQYSALVTEVSEQSSVGTALTIQLAIGFTLTVPTIFLIPAVQRVDSIGWTWAFWFLTPGPVLGFLATLYLSVLQKT